MQHQPVLLHEVLAALRIKPDGYYIDGTFGRGGHSRAILSQLNASGRLQAFDRDWSAISAGQQLAAEDGRFSIEHACFAELCERLQALNRVGQVDGILLDLGVSSPQLDDPERGFSFLRDGLLDMRMDTQHGEGVAAWLARAKLSDIAHVLAEYGEEKHAKRIAKAIVAARDTAPITHTRQLAEVVAAAHPAWPKDKHPATQTFQALRIFINQELEQLAAVLSQLISALAPNGRLAIISFHSLEDRLVKRFIRSAAKGDDYPASVPVTIAQLNPALIPIGKSIRPSAEEIAQNPRSRSAILRVAERK
ncbi:16S rRNA (cytosine(1402)-N(4))-methyltransferase RsmH [Thioflexithrix psekupsensis]|uniref:Ribosomal RNA small subunit methyltransferase H n=1 Tax=Thioflexithrix psekupsensis TaxID=1570016 RepID=A0A251X3G9_9GAMM|nr:16S rRNA (cytosine(1402)-N(4))-methyltransferase RsmH [Thioflexithrix psekupsensis]OUD12001.1 16S rRNA (cytosine(1402)-N(4))-methyltransferase [Thioflexithrix psekupsensis]